MYEDIKNYIAPSVTVLRQDSTFDPVTNSGDVNTGFEDNDYGFPDF